MLKFYYHPTPNSMKVALLLEELGLQYEAISVDIFKGERHDPAFRQINPNGKVPAIVDDGIAVFDSHAILLYLAQKHGRFLPADIAANAAALSWLQFVATGLSPFSGQAVHFLHYAPEVLPYAQNRYVREVERHYQVLDDHLAASKFLAGADYSVADMALWGWANSAGFILGDKGLTDYPKLKDFVDRVAARPAMAGVVALRTKHQFKSELDAESRKAMFPQNSTIAV
ncbi:MAG: glutathione S-transferase [Devosia sp.]|uniref:glutathione S-transferase family protein n=1 Tax=Devosia sp. TaxID=1871048 RepID=UPI002602B3A9|nr:glutathione S-transferase N-terminal domain-containing protein [Devosia sp.]MDB5528429.1 glutathione S-transferase [Devosia sp.]